MRLHVLQINPPAFGLDISDLSLKLVRLKEQKGELRLAQSGERSIKQGLVQQGQIKDVDGLADEIREFLKETNVTLETDRVVASLPEEQAFLQVVQFPRMGAKDIAHAIPFEAEKYIPYPVETVYLGHAVVPPLTSSLDHTDVLLASLPKETVDSYVEALQKAKLVPVALEIESLAVSRALIQGGVSPVPVLIADLGASRSSLSVFAGRSLRFTSSVPVSSSGFTQLIAKALKIPEDQAEALKRKHGLLRQDEEGKAVFDTLVPPLTDLVQQMLRYMDYYTTHARHLHLPQKEQAVKKILLCGGGANLPGLPEFLTQKLKEETKKGNPWVNIRSSRSEYIPQLSYEDSLRYTTAIGLAIRGILPSYD